jgi:hypothetical protein
VERAFGILQTQFSIVRGLARFWDQEVLWYIVNACMIMHNTIIENERSQALNYSLYKLMEKTMRMQRREDRIAS